MKNSRLTLALAAGLAVTVFAAPAAAETWKLNSEGGNHKSYIDADSLSRSGTTAKVREMKLYSPAEVFQGQSTRAWVINYDVDCTAGTYSTKRAEIYDDAGKVIMASDLDGGPRKPNPGTVGEDMINAACGRTSLPAGAGSDRDSLIQAAVAGRL